MFIHCQWECEMALPFWLKIWLFLRKLNKVLPFTSTILLLGIYPWEMKTHYHKKTNVIMFIAFIIVAPNEITSKSINRQIDFKSVVDWYTSIICINKTKWILIHAKTWINPLHIILSKISPTQEYTLYILQYVHFVCFPELYRILEQD